LVRMRQFWTRQRLVPVLGTTALCLFGGLTYMYFDSFFEDDPIVARHIVINGNAFEVTTNFDGEDADGNAFYWEFDSADRHSQWDHKKWNHETLRGEIEWDVALEHKRDAFELKRKLERLHERERELKGRLHKFRFEQSDDDDESIIIMQKDADDQELIIKRGDGDASVEIIVNGKKIEVEKLETEKLKEI
ncbi:MAG: hypothetical protein AAF564_11430, partial [Bacteroidota bacterium]